MRSTLECVRTIWFAQCLVGFAGCYSEALTRVDVELTLQDGAVWIEPDEIPRYRCRSSLFVCADTGGRLTKRLCRCANYK
jgi:hypothetical protein